MMFWNARGLIPTFWLFVLFLIPVSAVRAVEIQVFAAVSLTDALQEAAAAYETRSGDSVLFNFAASSLLARQIEEGAPADLFFSADEAKMDGLQKKDLILAETRLSLLSNILVLVVRSDSTIRVDDPGALVTNDWKIAIAEPDTVPAGIYAKRYLMRTGVWRKITGRLIPTENVRAALAAVESGNVDIGFVYRTDAAISNRVKIAFTVPASDTPGISYPAAVLRESQHQQAAKDFLRYLASADGRSIFRKHGFITK